MKPSQLASTKPRRWKKVRVGATSDARWRGVPAGVKRMDTLERHALQRTAR